MSEPDIFELLFAISGVDEMLTIGFAFKNIDQDLYRVLIYLAPTGDLCSFD